MQLIISFHRENVWKRCFFFVSFLLLFHVVSLFHFVFIYIFFYIYFYSKCSVCHAHQKSETEDKQPIKSDFRMQYLVAVSSPYAFNKKLYINLHMSFTRWFFLFFFLNSSLIVASLHLTKSLNVVVVQYSTKNTINILLNPRRRAWNYGNCTFYNC